MAASTPIRTMYYLYQFNEYSNRIVKKYMTINDYLTASATYDTQTAANFCELDGVLRPEYTYRRTPTLVGTPNYAILTEGDDIISRWYITDAINVNKNTFKLTLKRDSVADYLDDILSAPTYIEKGTLSINDPFIYNSEAMQFNQIKTSETLLKDKTQCPWIIGFMATNQPESTSKAYNTTINTGVYGHSDATYNSMANYPYWNYLGKDNNSTNYYKSTSQNARMYITIFVSYTYNNQYIGVCLGITYLWDHFDGFQYCGFKRITSDDGTWMTEYTLSPFFYNGTDLSNDSNAEDFGRQLGSILNTSGTLPSDLWTYAQAQDPSIHSESQLNTMLTEVGKIVRVNSSATQPTTGVVYDQGLYSIGRLYYQTDVMLGRVDNPDFDNGLPYVRKEYWNGSTSVSNRLSRDSTAQTTLYNIISNNASNLNLSVNSNASSRWIANVCFYGLYTLLGASALGSNVITFNLHNDNKRLVDAPYRMFALPYNDNIVKWKRASTTYTNSNKNINMGVAQGIATTFSGTWLYDLQLVPFCPFVKSDKITISNDEVIIDITNMSENTDYTKVEFNNSVESIIIWCEGSQVDNYHINYSIPVASTAVERKINNQCNIYRLSAPAYNSIFEFNAEKNGGVTYFDMDLVYKPYDSYIHINPNFGMLYGQDFNDARGLVFTGPFSLPQTTSAWMQYKLNNMNYQNSFDRQIENMEVMHDYDIKEQGIKAAMNAVSSTVGGAIAGLKTGGVAGAVAGGTIGAATSTLNYAVNYQLSQARYNETIDYTQDQFNYSLQNIKAQAQSLSKVSSFTPNNKVFPILEYYTCTGTEKEAFREKLKYNGMTVGKIDTIQNFYSFVFPSADSDKRYTKGKVIRLNIGEDSHIVEDIKEEINKGVFI